MKKRPSTAPSLIWYSGMVFACGVAAGLGAFRGAPQLKVVMLCVSAYLMLTGILLQRRVRVAKWMAILGACLFEAWTLSKWITFGFSFERAFMAITVPVAIWLLAKLDLRDEATKTRTSISYLLEIASMCGVKVGTLGGFDLAALGFASEEVHASVSDYFRSVVPDIGVHSEACVSIDAFRLLGRADVLKSNREYVPCCDILKAGFVSFGSDPCGDAIVADISDGHVYVVSHEISWTPSSDGQPLPVEVLRARIIAKSTCVGGTIEEFLFIWGEILKQILAAEEKFRKIAARDPKASDAEGNSLLILLVQKNDLAGVRREIDRGADLEHLGRESRSALGEAGVYGHTALVELLLAAGANPDRASDEGMTPLMMATRHSKVDCIKALLSGGADRTARDKSGRTARDMVCIIHGTPEIEDLLRVPGADGGEANSKLPAGV